MPSLDDADTGCNSTPSVPSTSTTSSTRDRASGIVSLVQGDKPPLVLERAVEQPSAPPSPAGSQRPGRPTPRPRRGPGPASARHAAGSRVRAHASVGALNQPRDVNCDELPCLPFDHAEHRFQRRERVARDPGLAPLTAASRLDFPAFGYPTMPTSAKSFSSRRSVAPEPCSPSSARTGNLLTELAKLALPRPPRPPLRRTRPAWRPPGRLPGQLPLPTDTWVPTGTANVTSLPFFPCFRDPAPLPPPPRRTGHRSSGWSAWSRPGSARRYTLPPLPPLPPSGPPRGHVLLPPPAYRAVPTFTASYVDRSPINHVQCSRRTVISP